jgi:membrane protein
MLLFAWVYYVTPNVEHRRFRWITPGAVAGVIVWLLTSWAFFSYVERFSTINATYGAFAAAVILLVWLWLTNAALLFAPYSTPRSSARRSYRRECPSRRPSGCRRSNEAAAQEAGTGQARRA